MEKEYMVFFRTRHSNTREFVATTAEVEHPSGGAGRVLRMTDGKEHRGWKRGGRVNWVGFHSLEIHLSADDQVEIELLT